MQKETTGWFRQEVALEQADFHTVCRKVKEACSAEKFRIRQESATAAALTMEAIYGSKSIAFLVGLIPYLGHHLPAGKRVLMRASVSQQGASVVVRLDVTPYMELLDCEEIMWVSQSAEEKMTDEYFATYKLFHVMQHIFRSLDREVPPAIAKVTMKPFAADALWRLLLYPIESFSSAKPVFIPEERGPRWCWMAFLIPEVWFLWHEIWGVSILAFSVESLISQLLPPKGIGLYLAIAGVLSVRVFAGIWGHRIYYFRYGRWLGQ